MDVIPYHVPGQAFTGRAASAVVGGRFVSIAGALASDETGNMIGTGPQGYPSVGHIANARALGVAARDAAAGATVMIYRAPHTVPVEAGGAFAAGTLLAPAADGRAVAAGTNPPSAIAMSAAGAAGDIVAVALI